MKILFVGATCFELYQFFERLEERPEREGDVFHYTWHSVYIDLITTGLGTMFTSYHLTKTLSRNHYDLVINAGIAGSYKASFPIGSVVNVISERFCDFGIEEGERIKSIFDAGFVDPDSFPFQGGKLTNPYSIGEINLPKVHGVTGNISHGTRNSINQIIQEFDPDIESMEGAAVFYVCLNEHVPFLQIRAISNYVDIRNTEKWDIPTAIENLTLALFSILSNFVTPVINE